MIFICIFVQVKQKKHRQNENKILLSRPSKSVITIKFL